MGNTERKYMFVFGKNKNTNTKAVSLICEKQSAHNIEDFLEKDVFFWLREEKWISKLTIQIGNDYFFYFLVKNETCLKVI